MKLLIVDGVNEDLKQVLLKVVEVPASAFESAFETVASKDLPFACVISLPQDDVQRVEHLLRRVWERNNERLRTALAARESSIEYQEELEDWQQPPLPSAGMADRVERSTANPSAGPADYEDRFLHLLKRLTEAGLTPWEAAKMALKFFQPFLNR